jgi:solute carrier family 35, member C2
MTSIHFLAQWGFSVAACCAAPVYFGSSRVTSMSWSEWITTSVPCGVVTSGDVGLSNLSLVRISITFYTMVKASAPIFVLGWAYLFGIERITVQLLAVVLIIAAGEFLTVAGEVDFDQAGFLLCLAASMLSGARWTLVQLKLQTMEPPLKTTIATMRLLSPSMFLSLFLLSMLIEKPWVKLVDEDLGETATVIGLGLLGAFFAIAMVLCEFYLIMHASAMILMIGGVCKEMFTILIGVTYFGDPLNRVNVSGCFVVFLGVLLYKVTHYLDAQKEKIATLRASDSDADDEIDDDSNGHLLHTARSPRKYEKLGSGDDMAAEQFKDTLVDGDGLVLRPQHGIELRRNASRDETNGLTTNGLDAKTAAETLQLV